MTKVVALNSNQRRPVSGLEAGQLGRRLRAIPSSNIAINAAIRSYGKTALARSRHLCVNNPYMVAAKEEFVAALVGDGIKPAWKVKSEDIKKELAEAWLEWTDEADADGLTDLYGLQAIIAAEMYEAGECFVRFRPRRESDGLSVPLQLQVLPSEMVPVDYTVIEGNRRIDCGIEFDLIGKRLGYWFYRNHPGDLVRSAVQTDYLHFVPADQILHLYRPIRAGQIRGIPHTLGGVLSAALLDLYDDAELERKRTAALFGAFITRNADENDAENPLTGSPTEQRTDTGQKSYGLEPGVVMELEPGQSIEFSSPADVGPNYEAFQYRALTRTAAGLGIPYAQMTGDLRQASYSSQRTGMLAFRRRISAMQNSVFVYQLCRPVAKRWLDAAVLANSFSTFTPADYVEDPRSFGARIRWMTPRWDWIDPQKDIMAEKIAVDSGFKPRSDVIESMGYDAAEVDEIIAADQERAEKLGIKFVQIKTGEVVSITSEDPPEPTPPTPPSPPTESGAITPPPKPKPPAAPNGRTKRKKS